MKNIIQVIKNNYRKFSFSFLFNLSLFMIFNLFFYCRYHTVDDTFMEMIGCGAYGSPDYHLIYINVIIGFVISSLYSAIHSIPWYALMHILMAVFSLSVIMYVFFNRNNRLVKILVVIVVFIISYEAYTKIQFTKTAAYLATAGYTLIAYSFESDKRAGKQIVGVFFLVSSFMIRTGMFLGCSAVCLACLLPVLFKSIKDLRNDKRVFQNLFYVGLSALLAVISVYCIDHLCYSSERWQYYKLYNGYTTQFEDIHFPAYDNYEKEYNELGIDLEDYILYNDTDFNDPDLFGIEKMQKVKELQPYKEISLNAFAMFLLRGYNTLFRQKTLSTFTFVAIAILLLFVIGCKFNLINWISAFYAGCATLFAFMYTYYMHGWFDRTTISIMVSILITLLYISDIKNIIFNKFYIIAVVCTTIAISAFSWNDFFKWNMGQWKNDLAVNHDVLNELYNDKDHLYLCRTSLTLWKKYYTPYGEIRIGAMDNISPLGDWLSNTPLSIDVLAKYDVVNPYKDMIDNRKVYFIEKGDDLELVIIYLKKHYNGDAEAVFVKNIGPYDVFQISSKRDK